VAGLSLLPVGAFHTCLHPWGTHPTHCLGYIPDKNIVKLLKRLKEDIFGKNVPLAWCFPSTKIVYTIDFYKFVLTLRLNI
jgi:hypothetical protein